MTDQMDARNMKTKMIYCWIFCFAVFYSHALADCETPEEKTYTYVRALATPQHLAIRVEPGVKLNHVILMHPPYVVLARR